MCKSYFWYDWSKQFGGSFFFQAEGGIRDADVTGVQTCALPIWPDLHRARGEAHRAGAAAVRGGAGADRVGARRGGGADRRAEVSRAVLRRAGLCPGFGRLPGGRHPAPRDGEAVKRATFLLGALAAV